MEGEIAAAASAQRLVLPPAEVTMGPVRVNGECRPGRVVSGDFFDVMPLTDGRIAIALGDVAGKGMQASVLMTTSQGFLRGVMMRHGDLRQAVSDLNSYLYPRCDGGRFISLWLGAIDPQLGTLEYVNGGHGHAWMQRADGSFQPLNSAGGPLVGVVDLLEYNSATVPMAEGERVVLLSDGILEQPRGSVRDDQFGFERVGRLLATEYDEPAKSIAALFDAVHAHAQGPTLADDATVVLAGW
jgi:serine phosphatase RsbU (regulator of sigma subunit)